MSIRKDLVIKISNGVASLDMPLQIYEKDHGIELRFKLMDYKYKYDKDPDNILNSNKEDILEAYTTIVNPLGYELRQINGEVVDDTVKFMIEDSYTDELEELGIYKLQIHVKCEHSEFSIPPVQFEVLERLKGMPLYAQVDEGVVDYSTTSDEVEVIEIVDGKLQLVWQSGEIITSTRLNAMVDYANSLHDDINAIEDDIATINAQQATQDQKITNIESNYALKSELEAPAVQVEGSVISCDSTEGYAQNVEVLGNTIQDADNLADIRSVGDDVEGQELYKIDIVSCGKNLFDIEKSVKDTLLNVDTGEFYGISGMYDTSSYIKVYNGKEYQLTNSLGWYYCFYDLDKNFLRRIDFPFAPEQDGYVCISYNQTEKNLIQLEVGTVATDYEPYQEQKLEILSPVQLEKVGDVADRLICKDGVWGVEKNVESVLFDGSDDEEIVYYNKYIIFDAYKYSTNHRATHNLTIITWNGIDKFGIKQVTVTNKSEAMLWLKSNPITIKLVSAQPTFIPLPHDQQVKLRTFAGKTNIHFETEIEGTIKAQIPQSITSTISTHTEQIDNLNKELNRVTKLEESTVTTVTTESDFTTVGATSNGYFEDVKLEGKTLVNLFRDFSVYRPNGIGTESYNKYTIQIKDDNSSSALRFEFRFKNNLRPSKYTMMLKANSTITTSFKLDFLDSSNQLIREAAKQSSTNFEYMDSFENIVDISAIRLYVNRGGAMTSSDIVTVSDIIILEGDHTQNPPEYFEGLKSVGDGVDELSVSSLNENLFDCGTSENGYAYIYNTGGSRISNSSYNTKHINVQSLSSYNLDFNLNDGIDMHVCYWKDNTFLSGELIKVNTVLNIPIDCNKITLSYHKNITDILIYNQSNKKPLLYYNPTTQAWEKPILRQWDSIEKHSDGKYYYHKRCREVVYDGTESWLIGASSNDTTILFYTEPTKAPKVSSMGVCDNFRFELANLDTLKYTEFIYVDRDVNIRINRTRLSAQDSDGFNQWLQANPTTVVYQLATEEVYECINIDLITYENETNFIVNSGAIVPVSTLKVMCNINNVVRELQQKVSNLENYIQHVMIDALNNALDE